MFIAVFVILLIYDAGLEQEELVPEVISESLSINIQNDQNIQGLYACGELVGGVFLNGYPGGSGLTSGAVFGRKAGSAAALGL